MPASVAQLDAPSDWKPGGRGCNPRRGRQHFFMEIDHEIFSTVILSLPLIQEGQLSVSVERVCTILVNRLEDWACPVNVWLGKLTALDMAPLGWLGHKTSTQTKMKFATLLSPSSVYMIRSPFSNIPQWVQWSQRKWNMIGTMVKYGETLYRRHTALIPAAV